MKKLLVLMMFLTGLTTVAAQSVNPGQIKPGTNGNVLETLGGVAQWGNVPAAAPLGSLQYNDDGVFGGANADWNTLTANAFQFGLTQPVSVTASNCDGTNCTFTATNTYLAGQQVLTSGFGGETCLNGALTNVLSTGLSSSQFEILESATSCSGSISGGSGAASLGPAMFVVNAGAYLASIGLYTAGTSTTTGGGSIDIETNINAAYGNWNSGSINIETLGANSVGNDINIATNSNGVTGGDLNLSTNGTSGDGDNINVTTQCNGCGSHESAANIGLLAQSTGTGFGTVDASISLDTVAPAGGDIDLTTTNNGGTGGYGGQIAIEAESQANDSFPQSGSVLISADDANSSLSGIIDMTASGPLEWSAENTSLDSAGDLNLQGSLTTKGGVLPSLLYSAAGTPLPTCASGINGQTLVVSDATSPTYFGAYTSGGGITAPVVCSYDGTSYGWVTY